ncbi:hypothetical protein O9G_000152 [Rozella allomycis CSF55]|uniref:Uncharacterized protein n=1 Tax=Rozella allomycis (strain CSF55) TaxID=988480 RepID=A0A075AT43_ROZAC|nr:hypothetical protein O9G_000152 [Rozella allomycis CSF55]|eukprot:EPZ31673.1 hypothetical protein O9G_000152 [Rozella allomycis CSF55]
MVRVAEQSTVQYIIATAEYDLAALNHELYHAVYHICPNYRKKVEKAYNSLPQGSLNAVERFMDGKGYHRNAYLMCNPMEFKAADSKLMQKIQRDLKIFIDDNKLWRWDLAMANKKQ